MGTTSLRTRFDQAFQQNTCVCSRMKMAGIGDCPATAALDERGVQHPSLRRHGIDCWLGFWDDGVSTTHAFRSWSLWSFWQSRSARSKSFSRFICRGCIAASALGKALAASDRAFNTQRSAKDGVSGRFPRKTGNSPRRSNWTLLAGTPKKTLGQLESTARSAMSCTLKWHKNIYSLNYTRFQVAVIQIQTCFTRFWVFFLLWKMAWVGRIV